MDTGGVLHASSKMRALVEEIAAARGLDLTKVGSETTVDNEPYSPLVIRVLAQNVVLVGHYDELDGRFLPDPACAYYTGSGEENGWVPLRFDNDFTGRHKAACKIARGKIVGIVPGEMMWQSRFADRFAQELRFRGFVQAAKSPEGGGQP